MPILTLCMHVCTVGNAAFHTDELYASLAPAIPLLQTALQDDDEKTRANAAGALGNLCRNSGVLAREMSDEGVVADLIDMAMRDHADACQVITAVFEAFPRYLLYFRCICTNIRHIDASMRVCRKSPCLRSGLWQCTNHAGIALATVL